jgi:uncharacterized membrane protein YeiH
VGRHGPTITTPWRLSRALYSCPVTSALVGFDPALLLVLNLAGTFAFGLSGALAGVRARLDLFGVVVLAIVVGVAGGITRDLLIGIPPEAFRDGRYLAVGVAAGITTLAAHRLLMRLERPVLVLDAAGLALFCVTGASTALANNVAPVQAIVLGTVTGVGGGVLRDILVREIPVVLRTGLYAVPALIGATIVVIAWKSSSFTIVFPLVGAASCFATRLVGLRYDINLPRVGRDQRTPVGVSSPPPR